MENNNRPLSPHLQIYRLPLTGLISITHRMTGVLLSVGLLLLTCSLLFIASGQSAFEAMQAFLNLIPIQIILWGFIYSLFFHLCHGIRHLIWDAGKGFDKADMDKFAIAELILSLLLTASVFFLGF